MSLSMASRALAVVDGSVPAECKDELQFEGAITVAQIFQGVAFLALAIVLIFLNNAKIGGGAKAPLEVRYQTSLTIAVAVCLFSGFFNILQMTGLDDFDLPRSTSFTLDLSRPVEWLLTCPVMQLILVILGGARFPSYRKFMMPLLTAANLLCGVAAMFSEGFLQYVWFAFGFTMWCTYTYYNIQQIKENSDGDESLLRGDSDYRKLTIITIFTWFPFPCWFICSPEGLGLITDIMVIQLGWAVLNVISKFGFILHLQHIKTKYCRTLEATRELYGVQPGGVLPDQPADGEDKMEELGEGDDGSEQKLITLVKETMVSLGLAAHSDRFLKLMLENGIVSTDILERLTQDRAMDLNLPWSLCDAVQRRWRAEKLNMGQDKGGVVEKEDPFKKLLDEGKARREAGLKPLPGLENLFSGTHTPPVANGSVTGVGVPSERIDSLDMKLNNVLSQLSSLFGMVEGVATKVDSFDHAQEAICQRLDFAQQAQLQTLNTSQVMLHKIDSAQEDMLQKIAAQKELVEKVKLGQEVILETLTGNNDSAKKDLLDSMANSSRALLQKLDSSQQTLLQKQQDSHELLSNVNKSQTQMAQKIDMGNEAASRRFAEAETSLDTKVKKLAKEVTQTCGNSVTQIGQTIAKEMGNVRAQTANAVEALDRGMAVQEERMADVRRQNMMIMDMLTGTQERVMQSAESVEGLARREMGFDPHAKLEVELRSTISGEIAHMKSELERIMSQSNSDSGHGSLFASAADRLEAAAQRMESNMAAADNGHNSKSNVEEVVRREISAAAMALAQQQREIAEQHAGHVTKEVGQTVRGETEKISSRVDRFEGVFEEGIHRLEQGLNKAGSGRKSVSAAADRG